MSKKAIAFIIVLIGTSFIYGLLVGSYKIFPYNQIDQLKTTF